MNNKSHLTILLGIALALNAAYAQTPSVSNLKNFFGLKDDFDFEGQSQYQKVTIDQQIVAFRRFNQDNFTVAEEYLHYKNDTFLLIEYSNLDHHISSLGKVFPSICCKNVDTVYTLDPESYEENAHIKKYWDWSKEGPWKIDNADLYAYGAYANNVKVGEWYVFDKNTKSAKYVYFDNDGVQLFEEPQNVIQTNNLQRITKEILGTWRIDQSTYTNQRIELHKKSKEEIDKNYDYLVFDNNAVTYISRLRCGTGFDFEDLKKRSYGTWTIDDENVLSINVYGFEDKKYKITYLSRYEMSLTILR